MTSTSKGQRRHLTPRRRLFAEALSRGRSQVDAARFAGYRPNDGYLSKLARLPKITREIERLEADRRKTEELTVEWWREQVWIRYNKAAAGDDESACAQYLTLAGRHLGALEPQAPVSPHTRQLLVLIREARAHALPPGAEDVCARPALPEGQVVDGDATVEAPR